MRVTDNMRMINIRSSQSRVAERVYKASEAATTGNRVNHPSDDPSSFGAMIRKDAHLAHLESRKRVLSTAIVDMEYSETMLASAAEIIDSARALAVEYSNGTFNAEDRAKAVATEIASMRAALTQSGNATGNRGFLFSGTATDTPAFTPAGVFQGNDGIMNVEVAEGVNTASNISGAQAFTGIGVSGGRNLFEDLDNFAAALAANDVAGMTAAIENFKDGHRQLVAARSDAGLAAQRMQSAMDITDSGLLSVRKARAATVEGDITEIYSELENAKAAYERSIQVTKVLLSLSSLNRG